MTTASRLCDLRRTATHIRARHLSGSAALILLAMGGVPSSSLAAAPAPGTTTKTATAPGAGSQDGTSHADSLHVPVQPAVFGRAHVVRERYGLHPQSLLSSPSGISTGTAART